jgi:hypothetical protein
MEIGLRTASIAVTSAVVQVFSVMGDSISRALS